MTSESVALREMSEILADLKALEKEANGMMAEIMRELFGSYARNEATEDSDVDIRIDKGNSDKLRGLIQVSGMQIELENSLANQY